MKNKLSLGLSKSLYTRGLQCSKSLWLKKYKREVLAQPDEATQAVFATGDVVGGLACQLFPDGKEVPFHGTSFDEKIKLTQQWIDEGVENIYEATFQYEGVLVMVDILHKEDDGSWEIYEVKSSTWSAKKTLKSIQKYIDDAAIQYYVLNGLGLNISKAAITLLNSNYVYVDKLDIHQLFTHVNVSQEVEALQEGVISHLQLFQQCLSDPVNEPDIDIGAHCTKPYPCDAYDYCWKKQRNMPDYSVFNIFNMGVKPLKLYKQGLVNIEDIPEEALTSENQKLTVDAWLNKAHFIDKPAIQGFLDRLTYPIYHLDFETFQNAVPQFNQQRPYQQICFQYSLHIEHEDGRLEHKEFLGEEGTDPRKALIESMIKDIPDGVTVLVYNESFEKTRIKELAKDFPQYSSALNQINACIMDLAEPFQKKHYYDYRLKGKYSIKLVMPLLAPHMANGYKELSLVQHGGDAMNTFPKLEGMDEETRQEYRKALLAYCKLDTFSMVEVLKGLRGLL